MASRFIVYGLTDPRTGEIRYIGKSASGMNRPRSHTAPSQLAQGAYRCRWVQSLLDAGLTYDIVVLEECAEAQALADVERRWIARGRAQGWPLTNLTDGGDGTPGMVHSQETREKQSAIGKKNKTPEVRARMSASAKRRAASPDGRAHLQRLGHMPKPAKTPETRARLSIAHAGRPKPYMAERNRSPQMRAKVSAALRGRKHSSEHRANLSAALRGRHLTSEHRARLSEAHRGHKHSAETRAKIAAANRRRARPRMRFNLLGAMQ